MSAHSKHSRRRGVILAGWSWFLLVLTIGAGDGKTASKTGELAMSKGVLCKDIRGYGDFDPLPEPVLTKDDKLTIYCEPTGFKTKPDKDKKVYRGHLTIDGRVRRKGRKEALYDRKKMIDYEFSNTFPPMQIYFKTVFTLKEYGPGEYEFDLTLHDVLGDDRTITQTVSFRVVATKSTKTKP